MVIVRRDLERIVGEGSDGVPNLDVVGVSFEDEGTSDGGALSQVEDGSLTGSSVGISGGTDNIEDAVIGRSSLDCWLMNTKDIV
jgi:hypothetical protein